MVNTDLFNFKFVDREIERKIVENFILTSHVDKVLWVHGKSGVGKTELIKYFTMRFPNYMYIHIEPVKSQSISYLSTFTKALENKNYSLENFILKNYKQVRDLLKDTITDINIKTKFISGALEIGEKIFIDKNNNFFSTASILSKFIRNISNKQSLIIIFDNFQQCDTNSLEIIKEISTNLFEKVKFIFITTDNTISLDSEIIKFLIEKIPSSPVLINPFQKKEYFLDILLNIYKLDNIASLELDYLFESCEGFPERLKIFLRNMYLANGIESYNDTLARFNPNIFKETLSKGSENIDLQSLNIYDKLVFKIILCWHETIPINLLENISCYIASEVLHLPDVLYQEITKSIYKLININIIELSNVGLKIKHDLLYISLSANINIIPEVILYNKLYNYINIYKEKVIELYSMTFFCLNNALYSYRANINLWVQINLDCLKILITQSDYRNINIIVERLYKCINQLNVSDLLLIAECFYNNGKFEHARDILNYAHNNLSSDEDFFKYYYLSSKVYNIMMDKINAENELLLAYNYVCPKSEKEILIKHMHQLILVEIIGRKQEAKKIFCSISEHLEDYDINSKAIGILLKNCSNYYSGEAALTLLEKALKINETNNDLVEKAYIKNNMGYEFFKLNNYEECMKLYKESIDILTQTKIHESAYPLSNLAICYMIDQKYRDAIILINRALFWNCSAYLDYVLNTHLMLCYEQIGETENSFKLSNALFDKVKNKKINDPVILRKVYLNLAINYDKLNCVQFAKICAEKAYKYSIDSSSEYRASLIYSKYGGSPINDFSKIKDPYLTKSYFDHWITIFSHD